MSKAFWAVIAVIVVVFGGIVLFKNNAAAPSANSSALATNHVTGDGKTGVKLLEYGDFQCPACYRYEPTVEQVIAKYKSDITFQFRNLPLLQVHQNAFAAARAAEAAALQNKFWQMHDLLYQGQPTWGEAAKPQVYFDQYAAQLGLNVAQFTKDEASTKVNDIINADIAEFNKTGEDTSTPTFFLNGKKIAVTPDLDSFTKLIDAAIAQKTPKQ